MWVGVIVVIVAVTGIVKMANRAASGVDIPAASNVAASTPTKITRPAANAGTKAKMQAAGQYAQDKDYATAEDIYKQVLKVRARTTSTP